MGIGRNDFGHDGKGYVCRHGRYRRGGRCRHERGRCALHQNGQGDGLSYKAYLDGAYEIELEYDAVSALKYAREYIKDTKLAELTGIPAAQLGRYANDKAKPRPAQRRKIVEALHRFAVAFSSIVP